MSDQPYPEVTLLRGRASGNGAEENDPGTRGSAPPRLRRSGTKEAGKNGKKDEKPAKKQVNPDERLRHVISILLLLSGLFLLLALVSYTPLDQANADVGLRDVFGLFTNDPAVAAKADTTQNWLGLLGAFLANFLINSTVGYSTIAIPALVTLWGLTIYKGTGYERMTRISLYTLGVLAIVASLFGTMQLVSWMPHPAHEWSGVIGAFVATIFTGLIGSAGSFLILLATLAITLVYATNSDLGKAIAYTRVKMTVLGEILAASKSRVSARLGEIAERQGEQIDAAPKVRRAEEDDSPADNEPAQMMRRMRPVAEELPPAPVMRPGKNVPPPQKNAPIQEPRVMRSAPPAEETYSGASPLPSPAAPERPATAYAAPERPMPETPARRQAEPEPEDDPMLVKAARVAMELERIDRERAMQDPIPAPWNDTPLEERPESPRRETVEIIHGAPAPPPPSASNHLTLNVQEGETDADLETEDAGALIERTRDEQIRYVAPSVDLLVPQSEEADVRDDELKENGRILQEKLATFNIQIENLTVTPGPVVTLYEFVPAAGIKIAQIESLADDIAMALKARGIRIIAPIPGKGTVGVEIPNFKPAMVRIRSVLNTTKFREAEHRLPLALGKTTVGEVFCDDLSKMPHLLIAGATGSGKSVGINAILTSLLYKMHPRDLKLVIIDPKKIELSQYRALRNHFLARCPDIDEEIITNPQNAVIALKSLELEMDRRYDILAKVGQRNIHDYNAKVEEGKYNDVRDFNHVKLPYIVLILDELADLMITAAREVEEPIARLAQLARAIGIHLIVATQRPSVDVITGVIKANFPARIAYQVASKIDSRTILDMNGAEQLLGNGDMLYLPGGMPKPLRLQNAFVSTEEVELMCDHIGDQTGYTVPYMLPSVAEKGKRSGGGVSDVRDELFEEAARLVVRHQQGSVSLLQRRLKVGYSRAARIVDELEMAGVVGPFDGSKARAVLLESEAELEAYI